MGKVAQVKITESVQEAITDSGVSDDALQLKKSREDEIRIKLDMFAKELSRVKQQRNHH